MFASQIIQLENRLGFVALRSRRIAGLQNLEVVRVLADAGADINSARKIIIYR
jgi:hypothetical protein